MGMCWVRGGRVSARHLVRLLARLHAGDSARPWQVAVPLSTMHASSLNETRYTANDSPVQ